MEDTADTADITGDMADITADILARCRREADTSSAKTGRHSAAAANGTAANGVAVTGAATTGAEVTDSSSAADLVIRTTGIGTPLGAGVFLTCLTTAIILMGIILRM